MSDRFAMRPGVRQAEICELLTRREEVSVENLAQKFDTSLETIRRDLTVLADKGKIRKFHGGARRILPQGEGEFGIRLRRNGLAKRLIAEKAVKLVLPHQTIFMDTGSTTLICAEEIARIKNLTIITNSTHIAAVFAKGAGGADIYLLGGAYRDGNAQTIGPTAIDQIDHYRADHAFITVGAIDERSFMDYSNHEAQIATAMIKVSSETTILADHTKFNRTASFRVCDLDQVARIVSDRVLDPQMHKACQNAGLEVL